MPYRNRLNRWLIVRWLPKLQQVTVGAFRRYSDEGHIRILRQLTLQGRFEIVFDPRLSND